MGLWSFAIIIPFVFALFAFFFKFYQKSSQYGHYKEGRKHFHCNVLFDIHEFYIIGVSLLMVAFLIFLLPFSLQIYGGAQYVSTTSVAMVIFGVILFLVFFLWEKYGARTHFILLNLLFRGLLTFRYFTLYSLICMSRHVDSRIFEAAVEVCTSCYARYLFSLWS